MSKIAISILLLSTFSVLMLSAACTSKASQPLTTVRPTATVNSEIEIIPTETRTAFDNTLILFARDDDLWQADIQGENVAQLTTHNTLNWHMEAGDEWQLLAQSQMPVLSPDGEWVIVSANGGDTILINLKQFNQISLPGSGAFQAVWSPDSRYVAYTPDYQELFVYDTENAEALSLFQDETTSISNIVWSSDGQFLGFGCCFAAGANEVNTGQITSVAVATGITETVGEIESSVGGGIPFLCWSHEGRFVPANSEIDHAGPCSYRPPGVEAISPDRLLRVFLQPASPDDIYWTGASLLTVENAQSTTLLWQHQLDENMKIVVWSPDGQYLLLDDFQSNSPIWRMKADNSLPPEVFIEEGYLLGVRGDNSQ